MQWTVEQVKEELPNIRVQIAGKPAVIVTGYVRGRKLRHARVHYQHGIQAYNCEASWPCIVRCLNEDKPLTI